MTQQAITRASRARVGRSSGHRAVGASGLHDRGTGMVPGLTRGRAVPHHRSLLFELVRLAEKVNKRFVVVGTRTKLEDEMRVTAIGFVGECTRQRQPLQVGELPEHFSSYLVELFERRHVTTAASSTGQAITRAMRRMPSA
jgi:hypothetical protein